MGRGAGQVYALEERSSRRGGFFGPAKSMPDISSHDAYDRAILTDSLKRLVTLEAENEDALSDALLITDLVWNVLNDRDSQDPLSAFGNAERSYQLHITPVGKLERVTTVEDLELPAGGDPIEKARLVFAALRDQADVLDEDSRVLRIARKPDGGAYAWSETYFPWEAPVDDYHWKELPNGVLLGADDEGTPRWMYFSRTGVLLCDEPVPEHALDSAELPELGQLALAREPDADRIAKIGKRVWNRHNRSRTDMWAQSRFRLYSRIKAALLGRWGEDVVSELFKELGGQVDSAGRATQFDRFWNGKKIEIKTGCLRRNKGFQFENIFSTHDFEYICLFGLTPDEPKVWFLPKQAILKHMAPFISGSEEKRGCKVKVRPDALPDWLAAYGDGSIADFERSLRRCGVLK